MSLDDATTLTLLQTIIQSPPSITELVQLSNAPLMNHVQSTHNSTILLCYMRAVAIHLGPDATESAGPVVETVSSCLSRCLPRDRIRETGILETLWNMVHTNIDELTLAHVVFVQACIYAHEYAYGHGRVVETWPRVGGLSNRLSTVRSPKQLLEYFYLRGTLHLGVQNWPWGVRCFWTCLCVPCTDPHTVSAIQVASYKKLILAQCLLEDGPPPPTSRGNNNSNNNNKPTVSTKHVTSGPLSTPKDTPNGLTSFIREAEAPPLSTVFGSETNQNESSVVEMVLETAAGDGGAEPHVKYPSFGIYVYKQLVQAFINVDRPRFQQIQDEHGDLLVHDGHAGLVQRIQQVLLRRHIYQISRVYATIPLHELQEKLGPNVTNVPDLLSTLAHETKWNIVLHADGFVEFPPPPLSVPNTQNAEKELLRLRQLLLSLDGKWTQRVQRGNKKGNGNEASDGGTATNSKTPRGVEDFQE